MTGMGGETSGRAEGVGAGSLLCEAVDVLLAADLELDVATPGGLVSVLEAVEVQRRRLEAFDVRLIAIAASPVAEQCLTEAAAHEGPRKLRQSVDGLLTRIDPDGDEPRDAAVERARYCHLTRRGDASWTLRGSLTDETG